MNICLVGLNHKTAPVEIRESVSISAHETPNALSSLKQLEVLDTQPATVSSCRFARRWDRANAGLWASSAEPARYPSLLGRAPPLRVFRKGGHPSSVSRGQ
jgi:hypothetical protein